MNATTAAKAMVLHENISVSLCGGVNCCWPHLCYFTMLPAYMRGASHGAQFCGTFSASKPVPRWPIRICAVHALAPEHGRRCSVSLTLEGSKISRIDR